MRACVPFQTFALIIQPAVSSQSHSAPMERGAAVRSTQYVCGHANTHHDRFFHAQAGAARSAQCPCAYAHMRRVADDGPGVWRPAQQTSQRTSRVDGACMAHAWRRHDSALAPHRCLAARYPPAQMQSGQSAEQWPERAQKLCSVTNLAAAPRRAERTRRALESGRLCRDAGRSAPVRRVRRAPCAVHRFRTGRGRGGGGVR